MHPLSRGKRSGPGRGKKTSEKVCGFEKRFYLCNRKTKAEGAGGGRGDKKREIFEVLAIDEKERQESNKQDRQQKTNNGSPENKKKQSTGAANQNLKKKYADSGTGIMRNIQTLKE